ncbi:HlyD family type I secretion periplasmic adaptor subunit [Thiohalorhabdus methylotrophus]|uniref:Membrane fusion protein (MFP) family protein n=1 Tax=Thiohalorhabdus methylotrophus TaxID=3242694 RepID=A0ABV4TZ55_9GAMM
MESQDRDERPAPEFNPRLLEVVHRPPSPRPRLILGVLLALVVGTLIWAAIGQLDVVAKAEGKLVPEGRLKIVQPFEKGRVERILVEEGDRVSQGEPLVIMDTRLADADLKRVTWKLAKARLELRRIRAELQGRSLEKRPEDPPVLFQRVKAKYQGHKQSYRDALVRHRARLERARKERASAKATRKQLQQTLPILRAGEQALSKLESKGYTSRVKLLDKRRARIKAQQQLAAQEHRSEALQAEIEAVQGKLASLESERRKRLLDQRVKVTARIDDLRQRKRKLSHRRDLMRIEAPQDGVVKQLATHTRGSVVPSGAVLMRLVPSGQPLKAEVFLSNRDVGFVHAGQRARLKLAAFDFQRYGTIEAEVDHVSPDAGSRRKNPAQQQNGGSQKGSRYPTVLSLSRQHMTDGRERLDLRAGMHITAEIKLGTRTVLEYILSPVTEGLKEAGRQR